jgi:AcrR family transcriptional regulator
VAELAKSIGFSKSYIYKFFDSKQAIGEVICANRLEMIMAAVLSAIEDAPSASEKLRRLFRALTEAGSELFSTIVSSTTLPPSRAGEVAFNGKVCRTPVEAD